MYLGGQSASKLLKTNQQQQYARPQTSNTVEGDIASGQQQQFFQHSSTYTLGLQNSLNMSPPSTKVNHA